VWFGRITGLTAAFLALVGLGGCAMVGPDFVRPGVPWLARWRVSTPPGAPAEANRPRAETEAWWLNFNDPVLDRLIAEAQRQNPGVRTAGLRIMEARAQLGIAGSALYPQLQQLSGQAARVGKEQSRGPDSTLTAYGATLNIAW
jgi:multidrug efflux system outer membrane protein